MGEKGMVKKSQFAREEKEGESDAPTLEK